MKWINAEQQVTVTIYDDEHEEYLDKIMTVEEMLDAYTDEGCPTMYSNPEQQPSEDCISREEVINLINHSLCDLKRDGDKQIFINTINSLPSATPKRPTGKWIDTGSGQECSECGEIQYGYDTFRFFCANCGAEMSGGREDEISD